MRTDDDPISLQLAAIVALLSDVDREALRATSLFGRATEPRLREPVERLNALRDRIGRAARARHAG